MGLSKLLVGVEVSDFLVDELDVFKGENTRFFGGAVESRRIGSESREWKQMKDSLQQFEKDSQNGKSEMESVRLEYRLENTSKMEEESNYFRLVYKLQYRLEMNPNVSRQLQMEFLEWIEMSLDLLGFTKCHYELNPTISEKMDLKLGV